MNEDRVAGLARGLLKVAGVDQPPLPDATIYSIEPQLRIRLTEMPNGMSGVLICDTMSHDTIWLASSDPPTRRRFTLWHEFAHYWLHAGISYCLATNYFERATEREADRFAACVLMPRPWIERDCVNNGIDVVRLARRYNVSREAMSVRLRELGIQ